MVHSLLYIIPAVITLYGIRKLREKSWGKCTNKTTLENKTVIITGANSGIGFVVAKRLAERKAQIILACRNPNLAHEAIAKIKKAVPNANLVAIELDLASLRSIKKFADLVKAKFAKIDILINNAGVAYPRSQLHLTNDQIEAHFGVNHLGHFYLTNELLELLKKSTPSRVITLSSILHQKGAICFEEPTLRPNANLYANSKLANVYFSHELARRAPQVAVFAVCPGWVCTGLFRHSKRWFHYVLVAPLAFLFMRSAEQGAQSVIYCATEENLQTGAIIRDCRYFKSNVIFDAEIAAKLWSYSEELIQSKVL